MKSFIFYDFYSMQQRSCKNILCLLLVVWCNVQFSFCQENSLSIDKLLPDFNHLTPEAASLGKYGTIAMSEYSGTPNIRIPLLTVKSGEVSYPIELYYDASGIKVEQNATFVGLGWNLSCGGYIKHIVCGHDDFLQTPNSPQSYFESNFHVYSSYSPFYAHYIANMGMVVSGSSTVVGLPPGNEKYYLMYSDLVKGFYTPDVFQGNFCGNSVSFYIGRESNVAIPLDENTSKYKIVISDFQYHYPANIILTDDHGVTYEFEAFKEDSNKDSYFLTHIYGLDGKNGKSHIELQYVQQLMDYGKSMRGVKTFYSEAKLEEKSNYPYDIGDQMMSLMGEKKTYINTIGDLSGFFYKVYPSKIITCSDSICFSIADRKDLVGARSIADIVRKSTVRGNILDRISFSYDYFKESSPQNGTSGKRLKLTGVKVNSKKYDMAYENSELPSPNSSSLDYWGYFNGIDNSRTLCGSPKYSLQGDLVESVSYIGNANRYASEKYSKVGMLTKLTYPTGGYSCFEYEPNRFDDEYYYPDAADRFAVSVVGCSANAYGTGGISHQKKEITVTETTEYSFCVSLYTPDLTRYTAKACLKNEDTGMVIESYSTSDPSIGSPFGITKRLTLAPGKYSLEVEVPECKGSSIPVAECSLSYQIVKVSDTSGREKGGMSLGAGLRIKNIKNYDLTNELLGETRYEYQNGKLLVPTLRLEKHFVDYSYIGVKDNVEKSVNVAFDYVNSEPSYSYICSLGNPATVGYSKVTKYDLDTSGKLLKKTLTEYYNQGYSLDNSINARVNNAFFYNPKGYLNGKIKSETVFSTDGMPLRKLEYSYDKKELGYALFPKCVPTHLPSQCLRVGKFDLAILRKPIEWCYLTEMKETNYEQGNVKFAKDINYSYNQQNMQISLEKITDVYGKQTAATYYWYPCDDKSAGSALLVDKHCMSKITGQEFYRNGTFTGGGRYDFTQSNGLPVINKCYSINSDRSLVAEATIDAYDEHGNILQYTGKDGIPVTLLWSYNYQCLVMKIVGATYNEVKSLSSYVALLGGRNYLPKSILRSIYDVVRNRACQTTAYVYDDRLNLSSVIEPNGYETRYSYDSEGRLESVEDYLGVLHEYSYNFKRK